MNPASEESVEPSVLWRPDPKRLADAPITRFREWLDDRRGLRFEDYAQLQQWSVTELEAFWSELSEFAGVGFHTPAEQVLTSREMPGARWFPGARLNYAEYALTGGDGKADDQPAIIFRREDGQRRELSYGQLRQQVAAARAGLQRFGVGRGDRVVGMLPNCPETVVAFLAAASLGAVWSCCSPDFGARAVLDRFTQIEPTVLIAADGYLYGGKQHETRPVLAQLREELPSLAGTVVLDYLDTGERVPGTTSWQQLVAEPGPLEFTPVEFSEPLWILYSSGTTGLPKPIVQGQGGILLEHIKSTALQLDLRPGERFFWFTTTGWMMWNVLIAALLPGATAVLYDGNPTHPDGSALWRMAAEEGIAVFGTSAPFVQSCLKRGLRPGAELEFGQLRAIGSTGAPLSNEGFAWLDEQFGPEVQVASVSGGTDLCTAFVCSSPEVPVWRGELSCAALGADAAAFDEQGNAVTRQVGELVLRQPMPSMPVFFWGDPDGSRLRDAYFAQFPGIWRHGDWAEFTERGSCVIYGRSDSTLNRGGVRMGTAEFYSVVESVPGVADSLVIDTSGREEGELLCFLVLQAGSELAEVKPQLRARLRAELSPRHVPNRFVVVDDIPRTLNGKKCEVPVKRILAGVQPDTAVSGGALGNPEALEPFIELGRRRAAAG